jgi:hypothetical protein
MFGGPIGCFHCQSINGSNPTCEDPFNSTAAILDGFYKPECYSGMRNRSGLYPASACLKIKGYRSKTNPDWNFLMIQKIIEANILEHNGETIMMRSCSVDGGSKTSDFELVRIENSCGNVALINSIDVNPRDKAYRLYACLDVCMTSYGCNGSTQISGISCLSHLTIIIALYFRIFNIWILISHAQD